MNDNNLYIYGIHNCKTLLKNQKINVKNIFITEQKYQLLINHIPASLKNFVNMLSNKELDSLTDGAVHKGVVIEIKENLKTSNVQKLQERGKILCIDSIQDPHNLGNIVRSAAVFGFDIIIQKFGSVEISPLIYNISSGGLDFVKVSYVPNIKNFIINIQKDVNKENWKVYSLSEKGKKHLFQLEDSLNNSKVCLVIGSENSGIRQSLESLSDNVFNLSSSKEFTTLNMANAAAVGMSYISYLMDKQ
jgi:23S rRNA (guanosine2251-2'-O)-methyltransferase